MVRTQTLQKVCVSHCEIWSVCQKIKLVNFMISPRPDFSKNLRLDIVSSIQPLCEMISVTRVQAWPDLSRCGLIWWQLGLVSLQFKSQKSSIESRITSQMSLADKMATKSKVSPAMDLLKQLHLPVWVLSHHGRGFPVERSCDIRNQVKTQSCAFWPNASAYQTCLT